MRNLLKILIFITFSTFTFQNNASASTDNDEIVKGTSYLLNQMFIADWGRRAFQAYTEEKPEVGIWALENFADIISKQYQLSKKTEKWEHLQIDLMLTYGRLALAYKASGDNQKYRQHISRSMEFAKVRYKQDIQSEKDLLNFIYRIDKIGAKDK